MNLEDDGVTLLADLLPARLVSELGRVADWSYQHAKLGIVSRWNGISLDVLQTVVNSNDGLIKVSLKDVSDRILAVLGAGWKWSVADSFIRRVAVGNLAIVPWHIDYEAAGGYKLGEHCVTCWCPLDEVGDKLPALEFVLGSNKKMRRFATKRARHREDDWVDSLGGEHWVAKAKPGDVVMFTHFTLHRTQQIPADPYRTNFEFRFVASAC